MALKFKISKADFDKLSDVLKSEYKADGEEYTLDVSGIEDAGSAKRAKDRETAAHTETRKKLADLQKKHDDLEEQLDSSDTKKLVDKHTRELERTKRTHAQEVEEANRKMEGLKNFASRALIDSNVQTLAAKLSPHPSILAPHIKSRLSVDFDGDEPKLVIFKDGKPSSLGLVDLEKEIVDNKEFAAILTGSRASGSKPTAPNTPTKIGSRAPGGLSSGDAPNYADPNSSDALRERVQARIAQGQS